MTKFNLAFPSKNQRQLLSKYLIAFSITFLFFLSIPISSHAACPTATSTAAEHVNNSRAASMGSPNCSSCTTNTCCQDAGASGYHFFYKCYSGAYSTPHACMSATGVIYTSTGGNPISASGDVTLYQGDNGNWYTTDPADCDATPPPSPPPSPPPIASTLTSGAGVSGSGVRPNIILAMNDSFLMNSEVLWTAASGKSPFTDTSRLNEMLVNRDTFSFETDSGTKSYVPNYDLDPTANDGLLVYGAGEKATSTMYNLLAYNPNATYTPWPGYPSIDMDQCNTSRNADPRSNTSNENTYCPKYFPEYNNSLEGDASGANSSTPNTSLTINSKYFVLDQCLHTGCKNFVAVSPTTPLTRALSRPGENSICGYLSTYKLSGSKGDCVEYHFRSIWETYATPLGHLNSGWSSNPTSDISGCNTTMIEAMGPNPQACFEYNPATGKWDGQSNAAFDLTCKTQFDMKFNWPCSGYSGTARYVTNILNKGQLESQYYVAPDGTTVVYVAGLNATELNNYANWFTYYRTLGHVQKAAILAVAYEAKDNDRLALADSSGTTTNINTMSSGAHRADLNNNIAIKRAPFTSLSNSMLNTLDKTYTYISSNKKYLYEGMAVDSSDLSANCRQNHTLMFTSGFWNDSTTPASASGTPNDTPVFGSDALSNVAKFMLGDIDSNLEDKVPVDAYSTISAQHIKTWIMQFDIDTNSDYDYGVQPSFSAPVNTSSYDRKRDDIGFSPRAGNGGYQKIESAGTAMSAAVDLLSQMTTGGTMCPSVTDCGDSSGKRISWKELQKQ